MLVVKIFNRIRDILGKKVLEFIHGIKKHRCMFDRKRICNDTCKAFYSDIEENKEPFEIIRLPSGIRDQQGKEISTVCLRLASRTVLGHNLQIFNKRVVREMLKENRGELIQKIVRETFREMANRMQ